MSKTIRIKLPTIDQVQFTIEALEEDNPIRGNAVVTGDDAVDKKVEDDIIKRLESNIWAWCCVCVTAKWKGLEGTDYLGSCSYKDENDFKQPGGYYEEMKEKAYDNLIEQLNALK